MKGYLTAKDIAQRLGVKPTTVHRYHSTGEMPPADERAGQSPIWLEETVETWIANRRGHGWRKGQTKEAQQ